MNNKRQQSAARKEEESSPRRAGEEAERGSGKDFDSRRTFKDMDAFDPLPMSSRPISSGFPQFTSPGSKNVTLNRHNSLTGPKRPRRESYKRHTLDRLSSQRRASKFGVEGYQGPKSGMPIRSSANYPDSPTHEGSPSRPQNLDAPNPEKSLRPGPPAKKSKSRRLTLVIGTCISVFLTAGLSSGFSSFKELLISQSLLCDRLQLDLMYTISSAFGSFLVVPIGYSLDRWGPKPLYLVASLAFGASMALIGAAIQLRSGFSIAIVLAFILLSTSGGAIFTSSFHVANAFPRHSTIVTVAINVAYDLSAVIFTLFELTYSLIPPDSQRIAFDSFFYVYVGIALLQFLFALVYMPWASLMVGAVSTRTVNANAKTGKQDISVATAQNGDPGSVQDVIPEENSPSPLEVPQIAPQQATLTRNGSRKGRASSPPRSTIPQQKTGGSIKSSPSLNQALAPGEKGWSEFGPEDQPTHGSALFKGLRDPTLPALHSIADSAERTQTTPSPYDTGLPLLASQTNLEQGDVPTGLPERIKDGASIISESSPATVPLKGMGSKSSLFKRPLSIMPTTLSRRANNSADIRQQPLSGRWFDSKESGSKVAKNQSSLWSVHNYQSLDRAAPVFSGAIASSYIQKIFVEQIAEPASPESVSSSSSSLGDVSFTGPQNSPVPSASMDLTPMQNGSRYLESLTRNAVVQLHIPPEHKDKLREMQPRQKRISLEHQTIKAQFQSPFYFHFLLHVSSSTFFLNYYMQTITAQFAIIITDQAAFQNVVSVWGFILPLASVAVAPFLSVFVKRAPDHALFGAVSSFAIVGSILMAIPVTHVQYLTMAVVACLRPLVWTVASNYAGRVFGFANFGRIYGSVLLFVGALNFVAYGMNKASVSQNNFMAANLAVMVLTLLSPIFPVYLYRWWKSMQDPVPTRLETSQ